jgi:hypothetical protein
MTDKELLELAAKAFGFGCEDGKFCWTESRYGHPGGVGALWNYKGYMDTAELWNPLTDDGDALRLAVKLNLLLMPYPNDKAVRVTRLDQPETIVSWGTPPDPCAATRRAIVRAAAEIGKGKP